MATDIRSFRDLHAWRHGMRTVKLVYTATRAMPSEERFGLTVQMRRAAVSVPSNIAEGYARQSTKDYLKHLRIARGSLAELMTQVELAIELSLLPRNGELEAAMAETGRVLHGLIRSIDPDE